jgi:energy-coupling factor transporter transmembrane protein EcfT
MLSIIVEFGLFGNLFFSILFSVFFQLLPSIFVLFREEIGQGPLNWAYYSHLVVIPALANTVRTTTASHDQKVYGMERLKRVFNAQIAARGIIVQRVIIRRINRAVEAIFNFIVLLY